MQLQLGHNMSLKGATEIVENVLSKIKMEPLQPISLLP